MRARRGCKLWIAREKLAAMPDLKRALALMRGSSVASEDELKVFLATHVPDYLPVLFQDSPIVATRTRWQSRLLGLLLRRAGK